MANSDQINIAEAIEELSNAAPDDLTDAIERWCEYLRLTPSETKEVLCYQNDLTMADIAYVLYKTTYSQVQPIRAFIKESNFTREHFVNAITHLEREGSIKEIYYFAFSLFSIGYSLTCLRNKQITQQSDQKQAPLTLVLVINARHTTLVESIRRTGRLSADISTELYSATEWLWMGAESEFLSSSLSSWFRNKHEPNDSLSEYDVYMIHVTIPVRDPDFAQGPGISQIARSDAFRRLANQNVEAVVSQRLPSNAYSTKGLLYAR